MCLRSCFNICAIQDVFCPSSNKHKCFERSLLVLSFRESFRMLIWMHLYKQEPKLRVCWSFSAQQGLMKWWAELVEPGGDTNVCIAFGNCCSGFSCLSKLSSCWFCVWLQLLRNQLQLESGLCTSAWNTWPQPLCMRSSTRGLPEYEAGLAVAAFLLKSALRAVGQLLCFRGSSASTQFSCCGTGWRCHSKV